MYWWISCKNSLNVIDAKTQKLGWIHSWGNAFTGRPRYKKQDICHIFADFFSSNVCDTFAGDYFMRGCDTPNIFSHYCPILNIYHMQDATRIILRLLHIVQSNKPKISQLACDCAALLLHHCIKMNKWASVLYL